MGLHSVMPAEGRWPIGRRGGAPVLMLAHRCCVGRAAGLCSRRGRVGVDAVASKPGVAKKCCRSHDGSYAYVCSKGGSGVNTTLCRTHELKSGDRRRPETERQGLAPRPSHDSRVASKEFVTHRVRYTGTARPNPIIGTPGVVTCASSLRCELHSRLQSPQVTTEDCPKTLLRDSSIHSAQDFPVCEAYE